MEQVAPKGEAHPMTFGNGGHKGEAEVWILPPPPPVLPSTGLGEPLQNSRKMVEKRKISPGIMKVRKIFEKVDSEKERKKGRRYSQQGKRN